MKSIIFVLSAAAIIFAGDPSRIEPVKSIAIYPQSMSVQTYHVAGFSNIKKMNISELSGSNPANITLIEHPSLGIQFCYGSEIKNAIYSDIDIQPANQWLPTSAVLVYPNLGVPLALGFRKRYSEKIDLGEIPLTTVDDMDGSSGLTLTPEYSTEIYSYSATGGYSYNNILSDKDRLALGFQFMLDQINVVEKIGKSKATVDDFAFSVKAGLIYSFSELASIGILYERNFKKEGNVIRESESLQQILPDTNSGNNEPIIAALDDIYPYYFKFPDEIALGTVFTPINNLNLNLGLTYKFWDQVVDNLNNNLDFSISSAYFFNNGIRISVGMITSNYNFKKTNYYTNNRDAIFLTSGIKVPLFQQAIHLQILDSHLFSDDTRKQTILKAGFDYTIK